MLFTGIFITLKTYIKKEEKRKINELSKHLSPEVKKVKIKLKQSEGSNNEKELMKQETIIQYSSTKPKLILTKDE